MYEDFFGLLRSWYEKARSRQTWQQLRLVISHATDVYIRLNINQSPFNVGLPIELPELTPQQVHSFAQHYEADWGNRSPLTQTAVQQIMDLLGGHPYLLEQAFSHLKVHPETSIDQLLQEALTDAGIYRNHLHEHWATVQQHPELADALKLIINANQPLPLEPTQAHQLQSMGLVTISGSGAEPRCNLYRQYFRAYLGRGEVGNGD